MRRNSSRHQIKARRAARPALELPRIEISEHEILGDLLYPYRRQERRAVTK